MSQLLPGRIAQAAFESLGSILIKLDRPKEALGCIEISMKVTREWGLLGARRKDPKSKAPPSYGNTDCYNYNVAMRMLGRQNEAIGFSWGLILDHVGFRKRGGRGIGLEEEDLFDLWGETPKSSDSALVVNANSIYDVDVICVKYGTKYGADYVNKLFRGVHRNIREEEGQTFRIRYICYTDDSSMIDDYIHIRQLDDRLFKSQGRAKVSMILRKVDEMKFRMCKLTLDIFFSAALASRLVVQGDTVFGNQQ